MSQQPDWFRDAIAYPHERQFLTVDGAEIEYLTWGERGKPGLLMLHGNMAHADWWRFIAPFFAADFHIAALSFSGMGRSGHRPDYTLATFRTEAQAVADAAGLFEAAVPPAIVAHSAGGGIGLSLAARGGFAGAIIIDSIVVPGPYEVAPTKPLRHYPSAEDAMLRFKLMPPQPDCNRHIADFLGRNALRQEAEGWIWTFDPQLRGKATSRDAWEELPAITCPLYFINGEHSTITTPERIAEMRTQLPAHALFYTIPDAHHHVQVDQPIAVITAIGVILKMLYSNAFRSQPVETAATITGEARG
jgi:pimeloyl-ACP methyl ester carboxylesterase